MHWSSSTKTHHDEKCTIKRPTGAMRITAQKIRSHDGVSSNFLLVLHINFHYGEITHTIVSLVMHNKPQVH